MQMPFGLHKGKLLEDIPLDYLKWISQNLALSPSLGPFVRRELERRGMIEGGSLRNEATRTMAFAIIQSGFRSLAKKLHPDVGGSDKEMRLLQTARLELEKIMELLKLRTGQ